jgi:lysophospholipase L1-like esterase
MPTRPSLFVIGDSISIDYGPHLASHLGEAVAYARKEGERQARQNLDQAVGSNGGDSRRVLEYLHELAQRGDFHPDLLLINCGLHDIKRSQGGTLQVLPDAYQDHLHAIVAVGRDLCRELIWIGITPVDDHMHARRKARFSRCDADVRAYEAIAAQVMAEHRVPVLPLGTFTRGLGGGEAVFRDGVHFLNPVKQLQGAFIAGWVLAMLKPLG